MYCQTLLGLEETAQNSFFLHDMKAYIHSYHTLSPLNSPNGILSHLSVPKQAEMTLPDYKELIPGSYLRRMSKVIKMGTGTALRTLNGKEVQGIIVGSGGGCYANSLAFIREYLGRETESLSPTAFIQSTDNTIAGQIALILKNYSYNITYIQKGLAFENALIDAMLLSEENQSDVLVGGVDEFIPLFELSESTRRDHPDYWIGEGSSFFVLNQNPLKAIAKISACAMSNGNNGSLNDRLKVFLHQHELKTPDLILHGNSFLNPEPVNGEIHGITTFNYSEHSGIYFSNSAFATQLAAEIISDPALAKSKGFSAKNILIVNHFFEQDWGFIYVTTP